LGYSWYAGDRLRQRELDDTDGAALVLLEELEESRHAGAEGLLYGTGKWDVERIIDGGVRWKDLETPAVHLPRRLDHLRPARLPRLVDEEIDVVRKGLVRDEAASEIDLLDAGLAQPNQRGAQGTQEREALLVVSELPGQVLHGRAVDPGYELSSAKRQTIGAYDPRERESASDEHEKPHDEQRVARVIPVPIAGVMGTYHRGDRWPEVVPPARRGQGTAGQKGGTGGRLTPAPLGGAEDDRAVLGDGYRVLEVRRQAAVDGDRGPAVLEGAYLGRAEVDHGLDGQHQSRLEA
jgi:hypothetical protein